MQNLIKAQLFAAAVTRDRIAGEVPSHRHRHVPRPQRVNLRDPPRPVIDQLGVSVMMQRLIECQRIADIAGNHNRVRPCPHYSAGRMANRRSATVPFLDIQFQRQRADDLGDVVHAGVNGRDAQRRHLIYLRPQRATVPHDRGEELTAGIRQACLIPNRRKAGANPGLGNACLTQSLELSVAH